MDTAQLVQQAFSILNAIAIIPGMWLAGRLLPRLITALRPANLRDQLSRPFPRLVIWLSMGALFTLPLTDIFGWLVTFVTLITPGNSQVTTAFGPVPAPVFNVASEILMLVIYGLVLVYAQDLVPHLKTLDQWERIFVVLAVASLIYRLIDRTVQGLIQISAPFFARTVVSDATPAYLGAWFVGLALIALILVIMNRLVPSRLIRR